ncbi:MAG: HD domain-containing protein [Thermovirga sp.]|nr:HD domain-containing protein [Thermovirga sp.]
MIEENICKLLDFLFLVDRAKTVERAGYLHDLSRNETDGEHMWHAALWAMMIHKATKANWDLCRVLCMLLIHDLVEIYAGDTYAYDEEGKNDQAEREQAAASKLFSMLPDDLHEWISELWMEFTEEKTPEALYANAIDRLQGFAQNCISEGQAWKENKITKERTYPRTSLPRNIDSYVAKITEKLYEMADTKNLWYRDNP